MIQGNVKDIAKLLPYLTPELQEAVKYIAETDFSNMENGKYELKGKELFAMVNTYATEPKEERRAERHNKYIDVQYVAQGLETIWYIPLEDEMTMTEDRLEKDDVCFYDDPAEASSVTLLEGDFCILFPWELHRPNCATGGVACNVQKVVVKVQAK